MIRAPLRAILPDLMRSAPLALALAAGLAALAACGSPCKDLAARVCNCQPGGGVRDACNQAVGTQLGSQDVTSAEEQRCQELLATCPNPDSDSHACERIQTPEGKAACGLAFPAPDAGTP